MSSFLAANEDFDKFDQCKKSLENEIQMSFQSTLKV